MLQVPPAPALILAIKLPLSERSTCENGSAVPEKIRVVSLVTASLLELPVSVSIAPMVGAFGASESTTTSKSALNEEVFPAVSAAMALNVYDPSESEVEL